MSEDDLKTSGDTKPTELLGRREAPPDAAVDREIGPYRLLERIGAGGMGEVWRAEQREPVRRKVALKLIRYGHDSEQVVARFEAERQALALMDHPAVAHVFDAGSTPGGRPYFVMEYVPGVPITRYCDRSRLSIRERLKLFVRVCQGVQHAHHKAIIHRDLKPSNVLVSDQDGTPVPKIIDFGVAKATAGKLTDRPLQTELEQMIGTPEYMSPEQARQTGQDVDTRTDVYALGVILYQLLVGALPFPSQELRSGGYEGIVRTIREEDPPRPSVRVSTLGDGSAESARLRRSDASSLQRELRGDLDWIVMKAMEKDRTQRYGSPSELSADIERFLEHEPVLAGPPSTVYRLRKFVRRNRIGVGVAAVVLAALAAGVAGTVWQALRAIDAERLARDEATNATVQAARAEQTAAFLQTMLESVDPDFAQGRDTTLLREILEGAASRVDEELADQPAVRADVLGTIGRTYRSLGLYEEANTHLRAALAIDTEILGEKSAGVAHRLAELASLTREMGRLEDAEALHRRALELRRELLAPGDLDIGDSLNNLALTLWELGRPAEAEPLFREALGIFERHAERGEQAADAVNNLALVVRDLGRTEEALGLARRALDMYRETRGPQSAQVAVALNNIARLLVRQGRLDDAAEMYSRSLELRRTIYGAEHPRVALAMHNLGDTLRRAGRPAEAERILRDSLDLHRRTLPERHPNIAWPLTTLGSVLLDLGRPEEAETLLREAVGLRREGLPAGDWRTGICESLLGSALLAQGRDAEAEPLLLSGYAAMRGVAASGGHADEARERIVRFYEARGLSERAAMFREADPKSP